MTTRRRKAGTLSKEDPLLVLANALERYLTWLDEVIAAAMKFYFEEEGESHPFERLASEMPKPEDDSPFEKAILEFELAPEEVLTLLLALAPHVRPQMLDIFFTKNTLFDRGFSEFGGIKSESHGGFLPTAETAIFLLCGKDLYRRIRFRHIFQHSHRLFRLQFLQAPMAENKNTELSYPLYLTEEYKGYFLTGTVPRPEFGPQFPAQLIETKLDWEDLVLDHQTGEDLKEIKTWLLHEKSLLDGWDLQRMMRPGFRSLFYGPPGTGKSLAASLIGKLTGRDVYRIDLSMVVSKYIGETEKNLATVFDYATEKKWILFFDEADALFGKRTNTSSSNDRHANQEVSFLLQRVEEFPGTVILATNFKNNIDSAFMRRFQSVVQFLKPDRHQRLRLWNNAISDKIPLSRTINISKIATQYELTGGEIVNVVRYAALQAIATPSQTVMLDHLLNGIRKELIKDGRMFERLIEDD